ncbi:MAG TPA: hypothetical protein VHR66_15365 [Gemmataceae bacterium]|jgi:hypothetical protein|nr:hypothetical protein [Gemmataceae bacterium]
MSVTIRDNNTINVLASAKSPLEVWAPDGRLLGQFVPVEPSKKMSFPEFGMTDEELERRENDPDMRWYTADEVMERLRQLRKDK